jgi:hypothetical protein
LTDPDKMLKIRKKCLIRNIKKLPPKRGLLGQKLIFDLDLDLDLRSYFLKRDLDLDLKSIF